MALIRKEFGFGRGIDRTNVSFRSDRTSFYDLLNFRHNIDNFGVLEQTPYFFVLKALSQGTYYASGSQTEPSTSAVRLALANITMTDYVMWDGLDGAAQLQVIYQTTYPAATTVYTGCRLEIGSITGLGLNLGANLDVEMTSATQFRWRKNGGAWTSGLTVSTAGVSIDGGNATLYFLANSGFAGTEAWSWTRTDCSYEDSTLVNIRPAQWSFFRNTLYFTNTQDRIMALKVSTTGNYVCSVGYRPVYGTYLGFFESHMKIGGYSATAVSFRHTHVIVLGLHPTSPMLKTSSQQTSTKLTRPCFRRLRQQTSSLTSAQTTSSSVWRRYGDNGLFLRRKKSTAQLIKVYRYRSVILSSPTTHWPKVRGR